MRIRLPLIGGLLVAGCSGDAPLPGGSAGSGAEIDAIELVEALRIGGLDGANEYTFGYVATLAPALDGSVYVADGQVPVLRRYDSEGGYLGDVGRDGPGPGEYKSIDGLGVRPDGELVVWDAANKRITFFGGDGTYSSSIPVRSGLGMGRMFVLTPEGDALILISPEEGLVEPRGGIRADWARVTAQGGVERLVSIPPEDPTGPRYVLSGRGGYYRPFNTQTLSAMGPDGSFYQMRNDEFAIRHTHPDGSETVITRNEPRIPVSPEEMREWEARSESFAQGRPEERSEYFPIPELKPYIRALIVDLDGRLWVSRYTEAAFMAYSPEEATDRQKQGLPSYQWRDLLRWDLFSPEDEYIGSVTFPFRTSFVTARGDVVWGVQAGDFREDYVVRWRMAPRIR